MTNDEMRELDAWIRDNIPGTPSNANPTRDPAAAMEVLEKCCEAMAVNVNVWKSNGKWFCNQPTGGEIYGEAETLPLAIALFAKALFTK